MKVARPAHEALLAAAMVEDPEERRTAVELWATRWVAVAQTEAVVSDLHPRVIALELASATRSLVEQIALSGSQEKVLYVEQIPNSNRFLIELVCLRHGVTPMITALPTPAPRRKKRT